MILVWLISILFVGGIIAWLSERINPSYPRVIALITVVLDLLLMLSVLGTEPDAGGWIASVNAEWVPRFGISFYLAADGLSVLLILLTGFLGIIAIGSAWDEIKGKAVNANEPIKKEAKETGSFLRNPPILKIFCS